LIQHYRSVFLVHRLETPKVFKKKIGVIIGRFLTISADWSDSWKIFDESLDFQKNVLKKNLCSGGGT
jgi:hypothetical protein